MQDNTTFIVQKKKLAMTVAMWLCYGAALALIFSFSWQLGLAMVLGTIGNNLERAL